MAQHRTHPGQAGGDDQVKEVRDPPTNPEIEIEALKSIERLRRLQTGIQTRASDIADLLEKKKEEGQ